MHCCNLAFFGLLALASVESRSAAARPSDQTPAPAAVPNDPLAAFVKASATVDGGTHRYFIEFLQSGDAVGVRVRKAGEADAAVYSFTDPLVVLAVLADRRLSFLWQPLLEWVGPSLELFRARGLANARAAYAQQAFGRVMTTTAESTVSTRVRAALQFARVLERFGHAAEAVNLLRAELARTNLRSGGGKIDYSVLASAIGNALRGQGDLRGGLAALAQAEAALRGSRYAANVAVNRAAYLAESGNYAEALTAVAEAVRLTSGRRSEIAGSDRQFGWIRACALHGLGRTAEAQAALAPVRREEPIRDPDFIIADSQSLRLRAAFCMKDMEGAVRELLSLIERTSFAPTPFVLLQPALRSPDLDLEFLTRIRADPRIEAALRDRMRILPASLEPALNFWLQT
jgi:tetratricopeptide (TPR) repeat protein